MQECTAQAEGRVWAERAGHAVARRDRRARRHMPPRLRPVLVDLGVDGVHDWLARRRRQGGVIVVARWRVSRACRSGRSQRLHQLLQQLMHPRKALRWKPAGHLYCRQVLHAGGRETLHRVGRKGAPGTHEAQAAWGRPAAAVCRCHPLLPELAHRRR
eukprot:scaffold15582_cov104-Isochrysis_galbana.AAC.2